MRQQNAKGGLSVFQLKCIAVSAMLLDHIGAFLYPSQLWLRYIGRLAFPIYCFLIVEGYFHTRDVKKYMGRLLVFALLSELPFDLAAAGRLVDGTHQNVFFTLALGLACVAVVDTAKKRWQKGIGFVVFALLALLLRADYGIGGLLMILCFYLFRGCMWELCAALGIISVLLYGAIQCACVAACIPIGCYNGKKGRSATWFFYAFYPVHLFCLYLIRRYL